MSDKKRVLLVSQEMYPYTDATEMSEVVFRYAQFLQDKGLEVRILMPRFGVINERRHRLHEVVRLSGMNITVNDDDYPLIIKVASLPGTRLQVYFLDNDEFFKRKGMFEDENGLYEDNLERMIFFCKGVIETVKKFGWSPDVTHIFGWMSALLPAYLKNHYKNEPIWRNARCLFSAFDCQEMNEALKDANISELFGENHLESALSSYLRTETPDWNAGAAQYADGVIAMEEVKLPEMETPRMTYSEDLEAMFSAFYKNEPKMQSVS